MRNPQRCFLLPPLFSQSTFCKALQGTRQLYDDSAYSSLTTQIHTHTNSKLYNCREERGIVLYAKCIYFFSSSKQKKKKKKSMFYKRFRGYFLCLQAGLSVQLYCSSIFLLIRRHIENVFTHLQPAQMQVLVFFFLTVLLLDHITVLSILSSFPLSPFQQNQTI